MHNLLLIEILFEELPANDLFELTDRFGDNLQTNLRKQLFLSSDNFKTFDSCRRMAVLFEEVYEKARVSAIDMPIIPKHVAYDEDGKPTNILLKKLDILGLRKSVINDLVEVTNGKVVNLVLKNHIPKASYIHDSIKDIIEKSLSSLSVSKFMRQGNETEYCVRPIRNVVIMYGSELIQTTIKNTKSSQYTMGHRWLTNKPVKIKNASDYEEIMYNNMVIVNRYKRMEYINDLLHDGCKELSADGIFRPLCSEKLFSEVASMIEFPEILIAQFPNKYLELPAECIKSVLEKHQKCFVITEQDISITNKFAIVTNNPGADKYSIASGYAQVAESRLSDSLMFYKKDLDTPKEEFEERTKNIVYYEKLGSVWDRSERIRKICSIIADELEINDEVRTILDIAAKGCKLDLCSSIINEFPDLQGCMAGIYSAKRGEHIAVCSAISEHYEACPSTDIGKLLGIADKIELLIGMLSIKIYPSGDTDPFGLRRAAIGIIKTLLSMDNRPISIKNILVSSIAIFNKSDSENAIIYDKAYNFIIDKLKYQLKQLDISVDAIESILHVKPEYINNINEKLLAIYESLKPNYIGVLIANKRIMNMLAIEYNSTDATNLMVEDQELKLLETLSTVEEKLPKLLESSNFVNAIGEFNKLVNPIEVFFEKTIINAKEENIRNQRLSTIERIHKLFNSFFSMDHLSK